MPEELTGSEQVERRIAMIDDWRGERLAHIRSLILAAHEGIVEEIKWRKPSNPDGVPCWSYDGLICTGEHYKGYVKLTFDKGASLPDPKGLFNASLTARVGRAIDIREDDELPATAFKALVKAACKLNADTRAARAAKAK